MKDLLRWDYCIDHYDEEVKDFFSNFFSDPKRKCLFIGGAGFDPRSTEILSSLALIMQGRLHAVLIKEERPDPDSELVNRAAINLERIKKLECTHETIAVDIFAQDNAVVGGMKISTALQSYDLSLYTDVLVDLSALSVGVSFPTAKFVYDSVRQNDMKVNIHLTVISNTALDASISSSPNDRTTDVRGFPTKQLLGDDKERARLWLPLMSPDKKNVLNKLYSEISPHDTCPIFPFPSELNPKKGDLLAAEYMQELQFTAFENSWSVDPRNYIYADECNPLDIYRTILKIDDERRPVFETFGGSTLILSPVGSRVPAVGLLMAAIERDFPVVYVEALEYHVDWKNIDKIPNCATKSAHIWLYGEAYYSDNKVWNS